MASLNEIFIKTETLETLLSVLKKKGEKGIKITISLNDETNDYGQNISSYVSQTKEQREAKVKKFYVGNGSTFWSKGETPIAVKKNKPEVKVDDFDFINGTTDDNDPF